MTEEQKRLVLIEILLVFWVSLHLKVESYEIYLRKKGIYPTDEEMNACLDEAINELKS